MMRITTESNPYGTMLDLLLQEAEEMQSDQILVISRSEKTNLYFVSKNRIQKSLQLLIDCTSELLEHLKKTRPFVRNTAEEPNTVQLQLSKNSAGRSISLTITKAEPSLERRTIDSTIKMAAVDLP